MSQMIARAQVQPFVRVVNAKTAQTLHITIPGAILLQDNAVIE